MKRFLALVLAYLFLGLAIIGIFIPGLPTVPFLLLAAWLASRGSRRLHAWMYQHPRFGKLLTDWDNHGAIPRSSKIIAVVFLCISWGLMFSQVSSRWALSFVAVLFVSVAIYLITRPEPK